MKKIVIMFVSTALLFAGCGKVEEDNKISNPSSEVQFNQVIDKNITEIEMIESGGEDGRANNWQIFIDDNGKKLVVLKNMWTTDTQTYEISDEDYNSLMGIDFSEYIGKKDDNEGVCDAIYYNVVIRYDDETEATSEASISDLWRKLYQIPYDYKPVDDYTANSPDSDNPQNTDNEIKVLYATQEQIYISQGYIEPHYMIYYIDKNDNAYSAMWKTNDVEPSKAIDMIDDFVNIEQLGTVSFENDIDSIIDEISQKELVEYENEELDVDSYKVWIYGCQYVTSSGSPLLIYQYTSDFSKYLNDSQTTPLVNSLYNNPTFQAALKNWSKIYDDAENRSTQIE